MQAPVEEIRQSILPLLRSRGVQRASLFGSFARGEAGPDSDLDILIEVGEDHSLLDIVGLRLDLEEHLSRRVDLVEFDAIKPALRERVLAEQVPIL